jgi:hypothetical protein
MSTSAIVPVTGIDFGASTATASQQTVFSNLLNQLQQAIGSGDLTNTATLLNAIDAISPSSATGSNPLGTFLTSLGAALNDGSVSEAQNALATYQSSTPASTSAAASTTNTSTTAANIAAGLIQSQIQLNLVTTLLNPSTSSSSSSNSSLSGLLNVLAEAYPADGSASSSASSTASGASSSANSSSSTSATNTSTTPYDTLVSSIQASLAGGNGTITPALAYLQASGNFVNTSA